MNAPSSVLYAVFLCLLHLRNIHSQQANDGNFLIDAEIDYQDFQLSPKSKLPFRAAKPRSPAIANAASAQSTVTPVPILKQINRHNEDGSYTYGFEGADGSFKIETKIASGDVIGKYGYVDDSGKLRVVEYGANKYGFQPAGEGITIPPINIGNETDAWDKYTDDTGKLPEQQQQQQYISKPEIRIPPKPSNSKRKFQKPVVQQQQKQAFFAPAAEQRTRPQHAPHSQYFVQEQEEPPAAARAAEGQKQQFLTPADLNSLQLILGNDFREASFQPSPPPPSGKLSQSTRFDENSRGEVGGDRASYIASFPIPSIFDTATASQYHQQVPPNEYNNQARYSIPFEVTRNSAAPDFRTSKNQARPKSRPSLLLVTPMEDVPAQNPLRRSSPPSNGQEGRSILDELMKQYALPNGSPAINDFSFSYNNNYN